MDWKCSSLQIGTWLGLEQLPKRSSLHLNTKLPAELCSINLLHQRHSLPMGSPQLVAHETTRIHLNHRKKERSGWQMLQCNPLFLLPSPLQPTPPWAQTVVFPQQSWLWRLRRGRERRGQAAPVSGNSVTSEVLCHTQPDTRPCWCTNYPL